MRQECSLVEQGSADTGPQCHDELHARPLRDGAALHVGVVDDLGGALELLGQVEGFLGCSFVGSLPTVRQGLEAFVAQTGVDELIVATAVFDPVARKRSYTLLAELCG